MKRPLFIVCVLATASCQRSDRQQEQTMPVLPAPAPAAAPSPETSPSNPPLTMEPSLLAEDRVNTSGRDEGPAAGIDESAEYEMAASRELAAPGGTLGDRAITQRIRQAVMEDGSFSGSAKSIEIQSLNGVVMLKGAVRTNQERSQLLTLASAVPGVTRVDNQLRIARD